MPAYDISFNYLTGEVVTIKPAEWAGNPGEVNIAADYRFWKTAIGPVDGATLAAEKSFHVVRE